MENEEWILQELQMLYDKSQNYNQKALIRATQAIIKEQSERIFQMEGNLDGTLWSPRNWSE